MAESRTRNSIHNLKTGIVSFGVNLGLQFLNRIIFLRFLSIDYLGVNGLFTNILSMLNLAELGVAGAMVYALYKPLAENDRETINAIMRLYKDLYRLIGMVVLVLGTSLTPFLGSIVDLSRSKIDNLQLYYLMYVLDTGISYFLTYKRSILICDQKQAVINIADTLKNIGVSIIQILMLFWFQSYIAYLLVKIICTFAENMAISAIANRRYTYLSDQSPYPNQSVTKEIKKNIAAMFFHKMGLAVVTGTDNIIITKFVSLTATGLYSNYTMIVNGLTSLVTQFFSAITASVGNLIADSHASREKVYEMFRNILFLNFVMYYFCAIGVMNTVNPFIKVWLGEQYLLDDFSVVCISLAMFSSGMRKTIIVFKDCAGLFWNDRYKPLLEAGANLLFSIPLAIRFGVGGTLLGTFLTNVLVAGVIEGYIVYKNLFQLRFAKYCVLQLKFYCVYFITIGASFLLKRSIQTNTDIGEVMLSFAMSVAVCAIIALSVTYQSKELKYCIRMIKESVFGRISK